MKIYTMYNVQFQHYIITGLPNIDVKIFQISEMLCDYYSNSFFSELRSQNGHGACEEEHGEEQRDGNRRFLPGQTWGRSSCDQRQFIVERSSTFDLKPDSDNGLLRHV